MNRSWPQQKAKQALEASWKGYADQTSAFRDRNKHLGQSVRHANSITGFYVGVTRRSAGRELKL
jgi:hypothetical protein